MRAPRTRALTILVPLTVAAAGVGGVTAASAQAPTEPKALLDASAANLAKVRSLHVTTSAKDKTGTLKLSADVLSSGNADVTVTQGRTGTFRLRKVSSATFLRGDLTYWKSVGGKGSTSTAKKLAGKWFRVSASDARTFRSTFTDVAPKRLATCLSGDGATGTLSPGGTAKVGGTDAVVLNDAGDLPGTAPGKLFIAAGDTPLPLRAVQTGPVKAGGKKTSCTDPDDSSTSSELRFSKFDAKLSIKAPKGAIRLP